MVFLYFPFVSNSSLISNMAGFHHQPEWHWQYSSSNELVERIIVIEKHKTNIRKCRVIRWTWEIHTHIIIIVTINIPTQGNYIFVCFSPYSIWIMSIRGVRQIQKLVFQYCQYDGSSEGMRQLLSTGQLINWCKEKWRRVI